MSKIKYLKVIWCLLFHLNKNFLTEGFPECTLINWQDVTSSALCSVTDTVGVRALQRHKQQYSGFILIPLIMKAKTLLLILKASNSN